MNKDFFKKNGYLISERILSNEEVISLRKNLDFEFKSNPKHALLISSLKMKN